MKTSDVISIIGLAVAILTLGHLESHGFSWLSALMLIASLAIAIIFLAVPDFREAKKRDREMWRQ
jgi:hypothetical protein